MVIHIYMFRMNMDFRKTALKEVGDEGTGNDEGDKEESFPDLSAVTVDISYKGLQNDMTIYEKQKINQLKTTWKWIW